MTEYHNRTVGTTVDDGGRNAMMAILGVVVVGALIWLFAFSGMVFDRNGGTAPSGDTTITTENNNPAPAQEPAPQEPAPQQPAPSP